MAAADLNGDGKNAFIVTNYHSNTVSVLLGNGNGTFKTQTTYATGSSLNAVVTGDGNGDGFPDLVVSNEVSKTASVLVGNGNGYFTGHFFTMVAGAAIKSSTSTNLASTSATPGANVTSESGNTNTERGVNYSLTSVNPNPQIGGAGVTKDCGRAFSGFSSDFSVATHLRL